VTEPIDFWRERIGDEDMRRWKAEGIYRQRSELENYDLEYGFWEDALNYDTLHAAKNIACPVLIVHGDNDECVPIKQSYNLAKIANTEVRVVKGADHGYNTPAQYAEMKKLMVDFIKEKLSP
jgi:dipeptidyl aminopeptidase/acylaminoacyl peptidase